MFYQRDDTDSHGRIRDLRISYLCNKTNELVFLQIEPIKGHCPGAKHLKSLIGNICLKSCLKSVDCCFDSQGSVYVSGNSFHLQFLLPKIYE